MVEITPKEIEMWKVEIDGMSQREMARLWRFAPSGHPCFSVPEIIDYFNERFEGMTPELSEEIGWDSDRV